MAFVAVRDRRRRPTDRASLWAAMTFLSIAAVVVGGRIFADEPSSSGEELVRRVDIALLVLFPFLLYRFTTALRPSRVWFERYVAVLTALLVVATFALPSFPDEGEARTVWFDLYLVGFLFHWVVLLIAVSVRLWRAGNGEPGVARRRMRTFSAASAALALALLLAPASSSPESGLALATGLLGLLGGVSFLLALAPPGPLRLVWRRTEQAELQRATAQLMQATTEEEVVARVLPGTARIVGARELRLLAHDGRVIGRHESGGGESGDVVEVDLGDYRLEFRTGPYTPFFGDDERRLLASLGGLISLALDRARLFGQERAAREALERADELKSQFVAIAAHELRAPVGAIYGIAETLDRSRDRLSGDQLAELETTLHQQIRRLRDLVEQLLDLSRLEAEVVEINPAPTVLRDRVEAIVAGVAAPDDAGAVAIEIEPGLAAEVDPNAFERIVSNLIVNAFRYGAPPIRIGAALTGRELRVVVEDSGSGVGAEFVPLLFERFARGDTARAQADGSGLGLAIARSYARAHNGDLSYRPAFPHGAAFELVLPV